MISKLQRAAFDWHSRACIGGCRSWSFGWYRRSVGVAVILRSDDPHNIHGYPRQCKIGSEEMEKGNVTLSFATSDFSLCRRTVHGRT